VSASSAALTGRLKVGAQAAAVALVVGLLGLLVWKVVNEERSDVPEQLAEGKRPTAPGFTLPRLSGDGELSLASLRGKAVVVNFWASWCKPCEEEAPLLEQAWRRYRSQGLVVVGVDAQDFARDARRFARKNGMTYPLVRDGPGETLGDYGVVGFPETFFINREGKLVGERIAGAVDRERLTRNIELALRS
jgi:cytochrome c biogenesis protein CcmG/thiol:disulfide interchange protein DsbE